MVRSHVIFVCTGGNTPPVGRKYRPGEEIFSVRIFRQNQIYQFFSFLTTKKNLKLIKTGNCLEGNELIFFFFVDV